GDPRTRAWRTTPGPPAPGSGWRPWTRWPSWSWCNASPWPSPWPRGWIPTTLGSSPGPWCCRDPAEHPQQLEHLGRCRSMRNGRRLAMVAGLAMLASACGGGGGNSSTPSGSAPAGTSSGQPAAPVTLTFWHGYTDVEADSLTKLPHEPNAQNPNITIKPLSVNNARPLQNLTEALQA